MGLSSPRKLSADISKGEFKGLYYFFGVEDYRISEAVKYVAQQFLPDRQLMTNFCRLDGRRTKCADLSAELSVFPMLGERQVFAVSDFQNYKPTEVDRIIGLLDPPDPNRIVILTSPSDKAPNKKSAFFKRVSATAETVEFSRLDSQSALSTITGKLVKAGLKIDSDALELMTGLLAGNRGALEQEVAKLVDYKTPGETITSDDIQKIAAGYEAFEVYQLGEAIVAGNKVRVLAMLKRLLAEGSTPTGLLYFIAQHFISLYLVKSGRPLESNRRWLEARLKSQAASFSLEQLGRLIQLIARIDSELRRKRTPPGLVLDQLVLQMMAP